MPIEHAMNTISERHRADILIIGGGAAGLLAALAARRKARERSIVDSDFRIVVLERNARPGAKIRISGGGKCNVTHDGAVGEMLVQGFFRKSEQRFLRPALYAFTNDDLRRMLRKRSVPTAVRDDGKVFPVSGRACDVLAAIEAELRDASVDVVTGTRVRSCLRQNGVFCIHTKMSDFFSSRLVLATGGVSYRHTGTTGDGLHIAASFGHDLVPSSPSLAPFFLRHPVAAALSGVALRDVQLSFRTPSETVSRKGDVLLTHKGLSGPACFSLSRDAADLMRRESGGEALVNFFPDFSAEDMQEMLLRHASAHGKQLIRKFLQLQSAIPSGMIPLVLKQAAIEGDIGWGSLTKNARCRLQRTLQSFSFGEVKAIPLDAGEVSAGGIALGQVNAKTMESRICRDLFLCGEILDYAGEVGGFNLQAAFSTGWLAGSSSASGSAGTGV
ncbi:HI0933 family protein [Prosthecochloris aestuarii DSM 271]|uniref:HI0933 family protein n=2 Tax=Prosthecochloris aestuarii TaxID=1102 RepID=B4S850_PROA2|nr:HI0933 family protein [Prosthecochloris aestuarii DSM 271]